MFSHTTSQTFQTSSAVLSKEMTLSLSSATKERETTRASKWQFSSTIEKTKFSTLPSSNISLLTTSATSNVSTHLPFGASTVLVFSPPILNVSLSPVFDVPPSTSVTVTGIVSQKTSATIVPSTIGAESKTKSTPTITRTPSILADDKSQVTASTASEIKLMDTQSFSTAEIRGKPGRTTASTAFGSVTTRTERTSSFFTTQATLPSLEIFPYLSTVNQTTSDRTKMGVSPLSVDRIMISNVTITSFSQLSTTLSTLKPIVEEVPLETTKTTVVSVKEGIKTTFFPILPISTQPTTTVPTHLTSLPFSTVKKEMVQTTSITPKPDILSTQIPGISVPSTSLRYSQEFLQSGSTSQYSPAMQRNLTEDATALHAQYSASTHITAIPLSTKIISKITVPTESSEFISVSHKTSTEYQAQLSLKTTKLSALPHSISMTKSETTESKKATDITTFPLETKKPVQTTGYQFTMHTIADTERAPVHLGTAQSEKTTSVYIAKPSAILLLQSTTVISKKSTSPVSSSPEAQTTEAATLHPVTPKKSFFSLLTPATELPSTTLRSAPELTTKAGLSDTAVTISPYTEFSGQLSTVQEVASTKGISTLSTSVTIPLATLSTTIHLAKVSPYTLTQKLPLLVATAKHPIETKIPFVISEPTYYAPTYSVEGVPTYMKEESTVQYFTTKTTGRQDSSPVSKAYLTTKGTTTAYRFPPEIVRTSIHPKSVFSTTEPVVKVTVTSPFQSTSLPVFAPSAVAPTSAVPAKIPLTSEKKVTYTLKAETDLTESKKLMFPTSEVTVPLLPFSTIKEKVVSFPTEKSKTDLSTTQQTVTPFQRLTASSTLFHESESTSPSLFTLEAPDASVVSQTSSQEGELLAPMVSTASTSMGKSPTEKISVLSKQVPLSTISYSSTFPALRVTPATPHFTSTTSAQLGISGLTTQSVTKSLAEKTAGIREYITTSLFSLPALASGTKSITPETPETDRQIVVTEIPRPDLPTQHLPSPATLGSTIQTTAFQTSSVMEGPTSSTSSLLQPAVQPNATVAASVQTYISTKPIYGSASEYSTGLSTVEAVPGVTTSIFKPSRETATLSACIVRNIINGLFLTM